MTAALTGPTNPKDGRHPLVPSLSIAHPQMFCVWVNLQSPWVTSKATRNIL